MSNGCIHVKKLNQAQIAIIKRHFEAHMWYQHIEDGEDGKLDFMENFRGIMREVFCGYVCCDRKQCQDAEPYLPKIAGLENLPPIELSHQALEILINEHLDLHKWYRHIADPELARADFIANFGKIVEELICGCNAQS